MRLEEMLEEKRLEQRPVRTIAIRAIVFEKLHKRRLAEQSKRQRDIKMRHWVEEILLNGLGEPERTEK